MSLNDLEPLKIGVFSKKIFLQFQAAIHILRLNCAETIQYRPGQPAYENGVLCTPGAFPVIFIDTVTASVSFKKSTLIKMAGVRTPWTSPWIDVGTTGKLISSACYDKQQVCVYLQPFSC